MTPINISLYNQDCCWREAADPVTSNVQCVDVIQNVCRKEVGAGGLNLNTDYPHCSCNCFICVLLLQPPQLVGCQNWQERICFQGLKYKMVHNKHNRKAEHTLNLINRKNLLFLICPRQFQYKRICIKSISPAVEAQLLLLRLLMAPLYAP